MRRSGLSGGRSVRIRVGPSGAVEFAHVIANQSNAQEEVSDFMLDRYLTAAVKTTRFKTPTGGPRKQSTHGCSRSGEAAGGRPQSSVHPERSRGIPPRLTLEANGLGSSA